MPHLHYKQLCRKERCFIEISLKNNRSIRSIAKDLRRNPSTISREIRRNQKPNKNKVCRVNKTPLCKLDGRQFRGTDFSNQIIQAKADYKLRCWYFEKRKAKYIASSADYKARKRKSLAGAKANPLKLISPEYSNTLQFIEENLHKGHLKLSLMIMVRNLLSGKILKGGLIQTFILPIHILRVKGGETRIPMV